MTPQSQFDSPAASVVVPTEGKHHLRPGSDAPEKEPHSGERSLLVHRSIAALGNLEAAWRSVLSETASPFQTFSWNLAWYRSFLPDPAGVLVFEQRKKGVTTAILPCYRGRGCVRLAGDTICDYQDAIAQDEEEVQAILRLATRWLCREEPFSHFHFEKLSSEGLLFRVLQCEMPLPLETMLFRKRRVPCPVAELGNGLEDYLASLPKKTRLDFRRSLNRLGKEAPTSRVTMLRDYEIGVEDLAYAAAFHTGHFRKKGRAPFCDGRLLDVLGGVAKDPDVGLQLAFLTDCGEVLSVDFGFARGGRYYGYLTAFDPAHARLAPGKCLLLKRIDSWVCDDDVYTLDFLGGGEAYKKNYTKDSCGYWVWSMRLLPRNFPNWFLRFVLETDKALRRMAKAILRRTGIWKWPG